MNKKILVIILIVFLLLMSYFLFKLAKGRPSGLVPQPTPSSTSNYSKFKKGDKIIISNVEMNDVLSNPVETNSFGDGLILKGNSYQIVYLKNSNNFLISILDSPFEKFKLVAEQEFLRLLGVSEIDACRLNVTVTTPAFANPAEAGGIYKLSFC